MSNKFQEVIELQNQLTAKIKSFGKEAIVEGFGPFFEENPQVNGVIWTQYTPYFNDGDTCVFSVGDPSLIMTVEMAKTLRPDEDYSDLSDDYMPYDHPLCFESYQLRNTNGSKIYEAFTQFWNQIPEDIFLSVFGDHVKVTLMRDGTVTVDDYEHD